MTKTKKDEPKTRTRRKKTNLHSRVRTSVGRGVDAFFASENTASSPAANSSPSDNKALENMLEREASAAGDVREELSATASVGGNGAKTTSPSSSTETTPAASEPAPAGSESAVSLDKLYVPTGKEAPRKRTPEPPSGAPAASPATEKPAATPGPAAPAPAETAAAAPPPVAKEPSEPVDVTPPRLKPTGVLAETPMTVEVTPPGPGAEVKPGIPEPSTSPATLSRDEILKRISADRFRELEKEIDELYNNVPSVLAGSKSTMDDALLALHDARALLWTSPERLVDAEYKVKYVRSMLERNRLSEGWGRTYGRRLLVYELGWLILFLAGFLIVQLGQGNIAAWVTFLIGSAAAMYVAFLTPFLVSLMWGGIGGVVGALYSLWWHVSEVQDFDRRYIMWYLVQPIMGFVLGGIVYLIIGSGFLALQGTVPSAKETIGVQLFPALVAVLGGFRQKFVYELLERIIRVLTPTPQGGTSG